MPKSFGHFGTSPSCGLLAPKQLIYHHITCPSTSGWPSEEWWRLRRGCSWRWRSWCQVLGDLSIFSSFKWSSHQRLQLVDQDSIWANSALDCFLVPVATTPAPPAAVPVHPRGIIGVSRPFFSSSLISLHFSMSWLKMIEIKINNFGPQWPVWVPSISWSRVDLDKRRWRRPARSPWLPLGGTWARWSLMCSARAAHLCTEPILSSGSLCLHFQVEDDLLRLFLAKAGLQLPLLVLWAWSILPAKAVLELGQPISLSMYHTLSAASLIQSLRWAVKVFIKLLNAAK